MKCGTVGIVTLRLFCMYSGIKQWVILLVILKTGISDIRERRYECKISKAKWKVYGSESEIEIPVWTHEVFPCKKLFLETITKLGVFLTPTMVSTCLY